MKELKMQLLETATVRFVERRNRREMLDDLSYVSGHAVA
jgi:hypothetical protein